MVQIENLPLVLTGLGLTASVLYYTMTLRNANKTHQIQLDTRKAQLFMSIYKEVFTEASMESDLTLTNLEFTKVEDWHKMQEDHTKYKAWNYWAGYYEGLALLVRDDFIDIDMVARLLSGGIISFWEKYRMGILDCRDKLNFPRFMIEFEYLANRVIEYGAENPELKIRLPSIYGIKQNNNRCARASNGANHHSDYLGK